MAYMQVFLVLMVGGSVIRGRINLMAYLVLIAVAFMAGWHGLLAGYLMKPYLELAFFGTLGVAIHTCGIFAIYFSVVAILHFLPSIGEIKFVTLRGKNLWLFLLAIALATGCGVALHGVMYR